MVNSPVVSNFFNAVLTCLSERPVSFAKMFLDVILWPGRILMPCHSDSVQFAVNSKWRNRTLTFMSSYHSHFSIFLCSLINPPCVHGLSPSFVSNL